MAEELSRSAGDGTSRCIRPVLLIVALFAGALVVAIICISQRRGPSLARGRLETYFKAGRDYQIFVGVPLDAPTAWQQIVGLEGGHLVAPDGQRFALREVRSFIVAYSSGEILDSLEAFQPLPPGTDFAQRLVGREQDVLDVESLAEGRQYVRITYGPCARRPMDRSHYTTMLKNVADERLRVRKFGGYVRKGRDWVCCNITGTLFTAEQFRVWYGMGEREWIEPGQEVSDPDNYGSRPVIWAYHCETESGRTFVAGARLE